MFLPLRADDSQNAIKEGNDFDTSNEAGTCRVLKRSAGERKAEVRTMTMTMDGSEDPSPSDEIRKIEL